MIPVVAADAPPGFFAVDLERPPIADSADARMTSWRASRAPDGRETFATGCVSAKIPGWLEDMRPPIEARLVGLVAYTAGRIAGVPVEARPNGDTLALHVAAGGPRRGSARTFVGFEPTRVATCFALCVSSAVPPDSPASTTATAPATATTPALACDATVVAARLEGSLPPPPPGAMLRAVSWAITHPTTTAAFLGALVALASALAVVRRRRPRMRARI